MKTPTVRETMDRETHAVREDLPVLEAISMLIDRGVTGVPVVDDQGRVLGVLSEEHCLKLLAEGDQSFDRPTGNVGAFLDPTVPTVSPDMSVFYVAGIFLRERQHRRFPVVEDGKLVGVITRKDLLKTLRSSLA
jgi:CBS domain-containing protein